MRMGKRVLLGFNAQGSHRIVDMHECHILAPQLFALVAPLRGLFATLLGPRGSGEVQMTLCDQGVDVALSGVTADGLAAAEALPAFAERHKLARLALDEGWGLETRVEPVPATVTLGGVAVGFPPGAFLQATADGEAALVSAVREATGDARRTLDLFAGLGTFALALPQAAVLAAEAARDAVLALGTAARASGRTVEVQHRDLYRRPFTSEEMSSFDAAVLDPPRAGAAEQVRALAASTVPQIAYVSCNPATFARDLVDGGYRLDWIQPVGQFRWSTHVELAAAFSRGG
jgi:23S rRNA (uracil1939-C5)-methyltransferase